MKYGTGVYLSVLLILSITSSGFSQSGWYHQDSGTSVTLYDVFAADSMECWVVGWQNSILHTDDGGQNWQEQYVGEPGALTGVYFTDASNGWAVGTGGDILRSVDGGENWVAQSSGIHINLWGVHFTDANNGWAVGGQYYVYFGNVWIILNTPDGGVTWNTQLYDVYEPTLRAVFFTSPNDGCAVGDNGTILVTSDGGVTWNERSSGVSTDLLGVCFTTPDTGFAVGEMSVILRTIDGGVNWNQLLSGTIEELRGISFAETDSGWTVGGSDTSSEILHTSDGGLSWDAQEPGTSVLLRAVDFPDVSHGWVVGAGGLILHTSTGGSTSIEEEQAPALNPSTLYVLSNYPEPFAQQTTISFGLGIDTHVVISLFDLSGRLIENLMDEPVAAGVHSLGWNPDVALPSGCYVIRIQIDGISLSERCIYLR